MVLRDLGLWHWFLLHWGRLLVDRLRLVLTLNIDLVVLVIAYLLQLLHEDVGLNWVLDV